jgi:hypothetical protein
MVEMTEAQKAAVASLRARQAQDAAAVEAAPRERMRTAAQGLTFGLSDEGEAAARAAAGYVASSLGFGVNSQSYDDALNEIRGNIKAYQTARPVEALAYEVGGAALPAIGALIAAPFTGGTSTAAAAPTLGRIAKIAALQGAATAFGTGEGGFKARALRVPGGAVAGAAGGTVAGTAMRAGGSAINALTDAARRVIGGRGSSVVENEIKRLVTQTGKAADQIADDILNGRILAENETIKAAVRAYRASGGEASTVITQAMTPRPAVTRAAAMQEMRGGLSDASQSSALQAQRRSEDAARIAERAAYGPVKGVPATDAVSREVLAALEVVPEAVGEVNKMFRGLVSVTQPANGIGPANVTFTRPISIDEAERVRRAVSNAASAEYRGGYGGAGEVFSEAEKRLRATLDVASPELGAARAGAAAVRGQRDAFETGQAALVGDVNEKLLDFSKLTDPQKIEAYRAGLMAALEARAATGSRQSMIRNLSNPETKEGQILRAVFPQDQLDAVLAKLETARASQETTSYILGGSPTADTTMEAARRGMGISMADVTGLLSGSPSSMLSVASNIASRFTRDLTDSERARVARILVSEDPDLVRRAISDEGAMAALQNRIQQLTTIGTKGSARAGAVTGAQPGATLSQQTLRGLLAQ